MTFVKGLSLSIHILIFVYVYNLHHCSFKTMCQIYDHMIRCDEMALFLRMSRNFQIKEVMNMTIFHGTQFVALTRGHNIHFYR